MSKEAQLAQFSKIWIEGSAGAAKTISAIQPGYPTIITSTGHGLSNGDVAAIAAIVGTIGTDAANGLNGKNLVISNVTTDTFAVNVDTTGLAYTSGGTATAADWTQVKEVNTIKPSGAQAQKIDVTDLDSTAMEYVLGLVDNGTLSFDINVLESDSGQAACLAAFTGATNKNFKVTTPNKTRTFSGIVTKWPTTPDLGVNKVQTGSAEITISGAVTVS